MKKSKEEIKKYFETGDKPTQQQFEDLIDSYIDSKQEAGEPNRRFVIDEKGDVSVTSADEMPEYTLSDISANKLSLLKDGKVVKEIDLTSYIDDTNLARLVSGTVDTDGIATFKRDDDSTFTVDFSSLIGSNQILSDWNQTDNTQPDFIKNKPSFNLQNNFAIVKRGTISHAPEIGSFNKFFNNLDDVLSILKEVAYKDVDFKIIIATDGVFPIAKALPNINGLSFYSLKKSIIKLQNQTLNLTNSTIYMPEGEIHATRYASLVVRENADVTLKTAKVLDEGENIQTGVGLTPIRFANSSGFANIKCYISNFYVDTTIGQSSSAFDIQSKGYHSIDLRVDKIIYKHDRSRTYLDCFTNLRRGSERNLKCKIYIGEIDLSECKNGTLQIFNGIGTLSSEVKLNNFHSYGNFDFTLGSVINPNQISIGILSNTNNANINLCFDNSTIEGNSYLLRNTKTSYNSKIKLLGKVQMNSSVNLLNLRQSVEKQDIDTVEVLLENLKLTNTGSGKIFSTLLYDDGNTTSPPRVNPKIVFKDCIIKVNGFLGVVADTTGNTGRIESPAILFHGENLFDVNEANYLLDRSESGENHSLFPDAVINYGKIFHNALNSDYTDTRAIQKKESIYTHII